MNIKTLSSAFLVLVFLGACSTVQAPPTTYGMKHEYKHSPGSEPSWVDDPREYQLKHPERRYFAGTTDNEPDMTMARHDAYADAMRNLANGIRDTIHNLYKNAETEDGVIGGHRPEVERAIDDGTVQIAMAVATGATVEKYWWREYWVQPEPNSGIQYFYSVDTLVSMSQANYSRTIDQTLHGLDRVVHDESARRVIKEMDHLWVDRKGNP